jgi:hypothetical protein
MYNWLPSSSCMLIKIFILIFISYSILLSLLCYHGRVRKAVSPTRCGLRGKHCMCVFILWHKENVKHFRCSEQKVSYPFREFCSHTEATSHSFALRHIRRWVHSPLYYCHFVKSFVIVCSGQMDGQESMNFIFDLLKGEETEIKNFLLFIIHQLFLCVKRIRSRLMLCGDFGKKTC